MLAVLVYSNCFHFKILTVTDIIRATCGCHLMFIQASYSSVVCTVIIKIVRVFRLRFFFF